MTAQHIRSDDAVLVFERRRRDARRAGRMREILFVALFSLAVVGAAYVGEASIQNFVEGLPGIANYIGETLPVLRPTHLVEDVGEWYWGFVRWSGYLFDTVLIAFLGTFLGAAGAFLLCFPASRNLIRSATLYFVTRRLLEFARAVPELVYAMIFVFAFGLGPFPGVLAIAIHTVGALGKLFSEVNENADPRPLDAVRAAGGSWPQMIRFGVLPQVLPNFASYALLRFEINVRSAAVIGFVGAGGIGQELMFVIRQFVYTDISAIVLMIVCCVIAIDLASEWMRHRFIGKEGIL